MALYVDGFVLPIPKKNGSMKRMVYGGFKVLVDA
jgi:uncharacterized protein YbaA (DUF1428 family)